MPEEIIKVKKTKKAAPAKEPVKVLTPEKKKPVVSKEKEDADAWTAWIYEWL